VIQTARIDEPTGVKGSGAGKESEMQFDGEASDPQLGFVHQALIYGSDQEFLDVAIPFIEEGLGSEEPTLVAVQDRHVENLRGELGGAPEGLTLHPVDRWYETSARTRQKFSRWVAERGERAGGERQTDRPRVRLIGEPPWAIGHEAQVRDRARHESVLNVAFAREPVTFICPYDATALPDEVIAHARRTHPEIVNSTGTSESAPYEEPLEFCRRLDATVEPQRGAPSVEISFSLEDLPAVRRAIGTFVLGAGLAPSRCDELVLAVNEITTNAVIHGGPPATVRAWNGGGEVVVEVTDAGDGIRDVLAGQFTPPTDALGGRGLWLTRLLCDAVEVRNGMGCTVSLHTAVPG
jgi:anti-sigma regulatory factor (Ser/Thr protein kinase)